MNVDPERVARIEGLRADGFTLEAIGAKVGISAERVRQILLRSQWELDDKPEGSWDRYCGKKKAEKLLEDIKGALEREIEKPFAGPVYQVLSCDVARSIDLDAAAEAVASIVSPHLKKYAAWWKHP